MIEEANTIFNYLPIRFQSTTEEEYQWYLWSSFHSLSESTSTQSPSFAVMPFHMLFMLAIQYKALRLSMAIPRDYGLIYVLRNLRSEDRCLLTPSSPFDFSKLPESCFVDLFALLDVNDSLIRKAKELVRKRNDLAHANGVSDPNPESTVIEYLEVLEQLQSYFHPMNDMISSDWSDEKQAEDDVKEFVETRLAASYLCPADFQAGKLKEDFASAFE